jgi:competence protein ComEC
MPVAAAVWAGAAWAVIGPSAGLTVPSVAGWAGGVLVGGLLAAALLRLRPVRLAVVVAALAWAAGFGAGAARLAHDSAGPAGRLLEQGGDAHVVLELLGEPRRQQSGGPFSSAPRYIADARLVAGTHNGLRFTGSARVVVVGIALDGLRRGDLIEVPARAEGGRSDGTGFLSLRGTPKRTGSSPQSYPTAALREALRARASNLPPDAAGLLPALAVGDRSALDPQLEADLRAAGLSHLTAVSGANFALVLGTVALALRAARLPRWAVGVTCGLTLLAFVAVVGPEASVLRAAAMGAVGLVALFAGRASTACAALCSAVVGILLIDPALALSYGFILSVLATLGITLLGRPLAAALAPRLGHWLAMVISVPLSAQLVCGPVVVLLDPVFQSWALPANILAAPLVPPITIAATLSLAMGTLCPPVAWLSTLAAGPPAVVLAGLAHGVAALPGSRLPWPEGGPGAVGMAAVSAVSAALVLLLGPGAAFHALRRASVPRHLPGNRESARGAPGQDRPLRSCGEQ